MARPVITNREVIKGVRLTAKVTASLKARVIIAAGKYFDGNHSDLVRRALDEYLTKIEERELAA
jgi:hypothetical protein